MFVAGEWFKVWGSLLCKGELRKINQKKKLRKKKKEKDKEKELNERKLGYKSESGCNLSEAKEKLMCMIGIV